VLTFCSKGENVSKKEPIRHSFCLTYEEDFGGYFSVSMCQCEDGVAPTRWTSNMKLSCQIKCKLDIPYSELEDFTSISTGQKMKRMRFDVEMVPSGASVEFTVYIGGRKQGKQNANIQFQ
jgi:hypothetical protein